MFKKKETLLENMAFMAVVAAINVIASLLITFFPIASVFIVIFLPFFSSVVAILCKWKYYPIYLFASIGVSFACTFYNFQYTLFYLIPSLLTGFVFGFVNNKKLSGTYSILFTALIQLGLTYAFIPLVNAIYGTDIINQFIKIFKLENNPNVGYVVPSFIFLLSLVQMVFSFIVIDNELKKFDKTYEINKSNQLFLIFLLGLFSLFCIPLIFINLPTAYLFMFIALFLSISLTVDLCLSKNKFLIAFSIIAMASGFLLIFILYNVIKMPYTLLVINVSNILIFIIALLYNQGSKKNYARLS